MLGTLNDRDFTASLTFLDACGGTGATTVDLVNDDQRLEGSYGTTGACEAQDPVEYNLLRQD